MHCRSKKMKVSVIIVNYNGKKFIAECLDSILASSYPNFEVVVVDNASTDKSLEYLKKKYGKNRKVGIIRSNEQLFFTGGSNLGAKKAKGEKLIFLNNDTVVDKDFIKELVFFAKNHQNYLVQPKTLFYHSKKTIDNVGGKYNFSGFGFAKGRGEKDIGQYDQSSQIDYVNGTCFMIDKEFFFDLGGFDEWYQYYYEDIDLNLRAKKLGAQIWYCSKSIIYHKGSLTFKAEVSNEELLFNIRKNRLKTIIKNFKGLKRVLKISGLLFIYFIFSTQDLLTLKRNRIFLTLKSLKAVFNKGLETLFNRFRLWELKKFMRKKQFSLLDLGCGDGSFLNLALENNFSALGVDQAPRIHSKIIHSSIESLKLSKKFEAVTMFHVLEHTKNPEKVLKKIRGFLKKDGVLVLELPLIGNLTEGFLKKDYFAYHDKTHLSFFNKKRITDLISQAGFKIEKKGFTIHQFPLTVLTTSLKKGILSSLAGLVVFLPLKTLSFLGLNDEIVRLYCSPE